MKRTLNNIIIFPREAAKKELSKLSINCFGCHNLKATSDGNPKEGVIYGPKGTEDPSIFSISANFSSISI